MNVVRQISDIYYNNVNDFLGSPNTRYLAKRFSDINYEISNLTFGECSLSSSIAVSKVNSICYSHKKHFGSIEAVSIASTLTEMFIVGRFLLKNKDLDCLKIKEMNFTVKKGDESSEFESSVSYTPIKGSKELFQFVSKVQNFRITFLIEIPFVLQQCWNTNMVDQFISTLSYRYNYKGYKASNIDIKDIFLDTQNKKIMSSYSVQNNWKNKGLIVGNSVKLSHIDFIRISGQLIQTLLYNLEGMSREMASNMWVKNLKIEFTEAIKEQAAIYFSEFNSVMLKNEQWRVFNSCIQMGHLKGSMKLCHKLN
jgi:hypothetical protein